MHKISDKKKCKKLYRITTISASLNILLKGQLRYFNMFFSVTGISSKGVDTDVIRKREGIKVVTINMCRDISIFRDIVSLVTLWLFFFIKRPYIVHANTPKASFLSMIAGFFAFVPHRIYSVTGLKFEGSQGYTKKILILIEKITCFLATDIIPEGEGVKSTLQKYKITSKELNVLGYGSLNGIDINYFCKNNFTEIDQFKLKTQLNLINTFNFCFIGRLVRDKGVTELINTFMKINKNNPYTRLILVGDFEEDLDPLDYQTIQYIKTFKDICWVGYQSDVRLYLLISDIFVFPSYREGFPNVVMQACAMDLPCIVSDINGCNEIIENNINGIIIPPKNEEILKNAMIDLMNDKSKRDRMSLIARKMIVDRYEQSQVWNNLLQKYQSL
jgi:glycosyltransferase involved in cell wall biosynthesis